jgi:flagellar hook assembly protein FlgD
MCCTPTRQTRLNPETQIAFELPQDSAVRLEIYDVLGQRVRTLVAGQLSAGSHRVLWNGRDQHGVQVSSGAYFYRLQAGAFVSTRRMMLI